MAKNITNLHIVDLSAPASALAVARAIGVSRQAVQEMLADGRVGEPKTNGELLKAIYERLRTTAAKRGVVQQEADDQLNPQQEKAMLDRSRREGQDIKNAVEKGKFAPIELLADTLAQASVAVVDRFDQLDATVRKSCPDMTPLQVDTVKKVIANARNAWVVGTSKLISESLDDMGEQDDESDDETD